MKTTLSEPSSTERLLEIEIPRERYDRIFNEKIKKYSKELKLNGFRAGNIPKQVVVSRFGQPIASESLEAVVDEALREACKEHDIEPVGPGKIEKLENEPDKPILVKAKLEVDSKVDIKGYPVEIPLPEPEIPEEVVEEQVKRLQKRLSLENKVERAAKTGDVVVAEYLNIIIDGEIQPLPQYKEFRAELGAGSLPDFDRQLDGAVAGEERDVEMTFPADYSQANMAGKTTQYRLLIKEINEQVLPELDDAFAEKLGLSDLDGLRAKIREDLKNQALEQAKEAAYEQAVQKLIEANPFDVPKARINNYVHYRMEQMGSEHGHHHGEDDHDHDHDHNHDHDHEGHVHPPGLDKEAEYTLKRYRILEEIARKEKIKALPEEVDERIHELAAQYGTDFDTLKAALRKNGKVNDLREDIKARKTLDFVIGRLPVTA